MKSSIRSGLLCSYILSLYVSNDAIVHTMDIDASNFVSRRHQPKGSDQASSPDPKGSRADMLFITLAHGLILHLSPFGAIGLQETEQLFSKGRSNITLFETGSFVHFFVDILR